MPGRRARIDTASAKRCSICKLAKPRDAFTPIKGTPYTRPECKACRRGRYRAKRPLSKAAQERLELAALSPPRKRCIGCGQVKLLLADFTPIKSQPGKHYPRCKPCRNAKARARYYSTPEIHAAEIARVRRNRQANLDRILAS